MALTDLQARRAVAGDRDYKLADSGGLHLFVTKAGHKSWRLKYRFAGKEKRLLLGPYPDVSLARARELRDDAKRLLREDRDPSLEQRKRQMAAHAAAGATFARYAALWQEAQKKRWSPVHVRKTEQALKRDVLPLLGSLPLIDIDAPLVLQALRKVERRGAIDTAKRIRQHVSAIFQFAMAEGVVGADPAAGVGRTLLPTPPGGRQPAMRTLKEARELLAVMDASSSDPATKLASRLLALTAARPGMVRTARWTDFMGIDWTNPESVPKNPIWRVPADQMKLDSGTKPMKRSITRCRLPRRQSSPCIKSAGHHRRLRLSFREQALTAQSHVREHDRLYVRSERLLRTPCSAWVALHLLDGDERACGQGAPTGRQGDHRRYAGASPEGSFRLGDGLQPRTPLGIAAAKSPTSGRIC